MGLSQVQVGVFDPQNEFVDDFPHFFGNIIGDLLRVIVIIVIVKVAHLSVGSEKFNSFYIFVKNC